MYSYSKKSRDRLDTCDERLQDIFNILIDYMDVSILEGHRGEEVQNNYYDEGKSKLRYPDSKHNKSPSLAVDVAPYPIDWEDRERFVNMAGKVKGIAVAMNIDIRWGGDFNRNNDLTDESFLDLVHFELVD